VRLNALTDRARSIRRLHQIFFQNGQFVATENGAWRITAKGAREFELDLNVNEPAWGGVTARQAMLVLTSLQP